eukprot:Rmarinus@m.9062
MTFRPCLAKVFFLKLRRFVVQFKLLHVNPGRLYRQSYEWKIKVIFDMQRRGGEMDVTLHASKIVYPAAPLSSTVWLPLLNTLIILLATVLSIFKLYMAVKAKKLLDSWVWLTVISNCFLLVGALFIFRKYAGLEEDPLPRLLCIGLGCALSVVSLLQYLPRDADYNLLFRTIRESLPDVGRFVAGVLPVYLAYVFFGTIFFSDKSSAFKNLAQTSITLFSVMQGDALVDRFEELSAAQPVIGQVYLYSYMALFIFVVFNLFLAIIAEAYFQYSRTQLTRRLAKRSEAVSSVHSSYGGEHKLQFFPDDGDSELYEVDPSEMSFPTGGRDSSGRAGGGARGYGLRGALSEGSGTGSGGVGGGVRSLDRLPDASCRPGPNERDRMLAPRQTRSLGHIPEVEPLNDDEPLQGLFSGTTMLHLLEEELGLRTEEEFAEMLHVASMDNSQI